MPDHRMNRQIVMAERPSGELALHHFRAEVVPMPERPADAVLLRNILVSVAPGARAAMQGPTHRPQLVPGELIPSSVIAEVVAGPPDGPAPGSVVAGTAGWQEYSVVPASAVRPLEPVGPLSQQLGFLGLNGLTAYFGIHAIAQVRAGETVLVSGAAGGVGHLAGQLARAAGARAVGISGSDDKNRILESKLGYAATVDRRSASFQDDLRAACPDGVNVYFDNVGGPILESVLPLLVKHGRIVCCGVTSHYDLSDPPPGPRDLAVRLIAKSLRMEGFLVADHRPRWDEALRDLRRMHAAGELTILEDIRDGLDSAPAALVGMMAGGNVGQLAVRLAQDPPGRPPA
ncbi:NADP-dependent oxidoreductase [Nonomuraea terrae]|uniref:NADP-dependent oxidoreductase n=1 Tax=Nonomuraea terrae TaxID=2530383 RepID=A0A4R4XT14_9ACTN|nr:NADP-dependent oxidoreductase [Nonomuraea terrae]TDD34435.1 NADP-dependent oxidoreductase [Nonomuraea terrae]